MTPKNSGNSLKLCVFMSYFFSQTQVIFNYNPMQKVYLMKTDNINSIEIPYHLKRLKKASQYKDKKQVVNPIIRVLKAFGIITLICTYFILAFIFYPLLKFKPTWAKAHIIGPILRILSVLVLKTFGYKVNKRGSFSVENGTVVVANQLSLNK